MSETTLIQPDKIRAYLATDYRLGHGDADIVLKIGVQSPDLAELFAVRGVECGAFITAYNPRGQVLSRIAAMEPRMFGVMEPVFGVG